jgi:DNA mismatch endonuclease (patch repair protein)
VETNRARDLRVSRGMRAAGWTVLRVWECALSLSRAGRTLARIARALDA